MKVKTDTKEKFHAITVETGFLSANMAAELADQLVPLLHSTNRNLVLNLKAVNGMDEGAAESLVKLQQLFYEQQASFVICELSDELDRFLDEANLLELMNTTQTESEAWDIVQMEEIERELMDDATDTM
jgi:anti-anti-sigma factor